MSAPDANHLLADAARWRLLGLLFERPRPGWHTELHALAAEIEDARFDEALRSAEGVAEGPYLAVMGPGGAVSPREVAYRPMGDPGRILAELNGIYEMFAYRPRVEDPADHVAVQVGFVGFLKLKLAYATAAGNADAGRTVRSAVDTFLDDHLSAFAVELAQGLERAGLPHLQSAASILRGWCPARAASRLTVVGPQASSHPVEGDEEFPCGGTCP